MVLTKNYRLLINLTFFLMVSSGAFCQVVINEAMSSNETAISSNSGEYPDWIEIYNRSEQQVQLNGYGLSDRRETIKFRFEGVSIAGHGTVVVFASGSEGMGSELHADFKLDKDGETVFLFDPSGHVVDSLTIPPLEVDQSYGRMCDNHEVAGFFQVATYNASNCQSEIRLINGPVTFSHTAGFYRENIEVAMACPVRDSEIFYTLDQTVPDATSRRFEDALLIEDRSSEPNYYANISTSTDFEVSVEFPVPKMTTVRAGCFVADELVGDVVTASYFIGDASLSLPVVSLVSEEDNLFSPETGILVAGEGDTPNYEQRGTSWERPISFEYFENGSLSIAQNIGVRIHGATTRRLPLKSLRLYAREEYGFSELSHSFFGNLTNDKFKRLLLRNAGQDFSSAYLRDPLIHELLANTTLDVQAYQPVVVFLNGEYWGLANLREYQDEHYVQSHHDIDSKIVEREKLGGVFLADFARSNDMQNPENYDFIANAMDIENFIDLSIADNFFYRHDNANRETWKSPGGKIRFFLFDMDVGLGGLWTAPQPWTFDYFGFMDDPLNENNEREVHQDYHNYFSFLFKGLMEADTFRTLFLDRYIQLLKTDLSFGRTGNFTRSLAANIATEMEMHIARWGTLQNIEQWENRLAVIEEFLRLRPCEVYEQMVDRFGVFDEELAQRDCEEQIVLAATGVDEWIIFPNPASTDVSLSFGHGGTRRITILDVHGRPVHRMETKESSCRLDLTHVPDGTYYVFISGASSGIKRLLKR